MKKILSLVIIGVLFALVCGVSVAAIMESNRASENELRLENSLKASLQDAVADMRTVEADISKLLITSDKEIIRQYLSIIALKSSSCAQSLGRLPIVSTGVQSTLKFAQQVSSYCTTAINTLASSNELPENFDQQIFSFFSVCSSVNVELGQVEYDVLNGTLRLGTLSQEVQGDTKGLFGSVDQDLVEYPSVIFDGPFSDGQASTTPKEERSEVSLDEARNFVKALGYTVQNESEVNGIIPLYEFNCGESTLQVTKKGGLLLMLLSSRTPSEPTITEDAALKNAQAFVEKLGIKNAKTVWQEFYGNYIVFNFAPVLDGVTIYPDLFKVKVALDNGEIAAFEGKSYIMENHARTIEDIFVLKEEAANVLKQDFLIKSERKCIISVNNEEHLCWEFFGSYNDLSFAVYISAIDGKEKASFRIINTDTGQMVI